MSVFRATTVQPTTGKVGEVLTLVCPHCAEVFPSMIQMDRPVWAKIRLESVLEHCSACGRAARFTKDDYRFAPDEGPS